MIQRLILPISKARLTAGMRKTINTKDLGYAHYGIDMISARDERTLFASGDGLVLAAGRDREMGKVLAILYRNAYNRASGAVEDIVFRYFHLEGIRVRPGSRVNSTTVLGVYGDTGRARTPHLHMEADSDTLYPLYTPSVSSSDFLVGRTAGKGTIRNPMDWLHCKADTPFWQSYAEAEDTGAWPEDITVIKNA